MNFDVDISTITKINYEKYLKKLKDSVNSGTKEI
jgi:hypothetical protein